MANQIRVVYEQMATTVTAFQSAANQLDQTIANLNGIVKSLQAGALLGATGDTVCAAVTTDLLPAIERLKQKMLEEAVDVQEASNMMQQAEDIVSSMDV